MKVGPSWDGESMEQVIYDIILCCPLVLWSTLHFHFICVQSCWIQWSHCYQLEHGVDNIVVMSGLSNCVSVYWWMLGQFRSFILIAHNIACNINCLCCSGTKRTNATFSPLISVDKKNPLYDSSIIKLTKEWLKSYCATLGVVTRF